MVQFGNYNDFLNKSKDLLETCKHCCIFKYKSFRNSLLKLNHFLIKSWETFLQEKYQ